jgi:DNA-binding NarL/FixJ family response regulator
VNDWEGEIPYELVLHVSPRQRQIMPLLARGYTDKEIGRTLEISERTVEAHLTQLYERTGIHRRAGLVALWLRQGGDRG